MGGTTSQTKFQNDAVGTFDSTLEGYFDFSNLTQKGLVVCNDFKSDAFMQLKAVNFGQALPTGIYGLKFEHVSGVMPANWPIFSIEILHNGDVKVLSTEERNRKIPPGNGDIHANTAKVILISD